MQYFKKHHRPSSYSSKDTSPQKQANSLQYVQQETPQSDTISPTDTAVPTTKPRGRNASEVPITTRPFNTSIVVSDEKSLDQSPEVDLDKKIPNIQGLNRHKRPKSTFMKTSDVNSLRRIPTGPMKGKSLYDLGPDETDLSEKDLEDHPRNPITKTNINENSLHEIGKEKEPASERGNLISERGGEPENLTTRSRYGYNKTVLLTTHGMETEADEFIPETIRIEIANDAAGNSEINKIRENPKLQELDKKFQELQEKENLKLKRKNLTPQVTLDNYKIKKDYFAFTSSETYKFSTKLIVYILFVYILGPLALLFAGNAYKKEIIRSVLNFGVLGCIQGIAQVLVLYHLIDVPILNRIKEVEGKNRGLINPSSFVVINKTNILGMIVFSCGVQIISGLIIKAADITVNGNCILISSLITAAINGLLWFIFIWKKSPKTLRNENKILEKDLNEIGQIRKDFLKDLNSTRQKIEAQEFNQNTFKAAAGGNMNAAFLGFTSNAVNNDKMDFRKLLHKVYDFSAEFKKKRLESFKAVTILILPWAQLIAMINIIKLIENTETIAVSLVYVFVLFVVGSAFGFMDVFTAPTQPVLNKMKTVSLIVTAAAYRFLFVNLSSKNKMMGAAVIKLLYKIVMHFFVVSCGENVMQRVKKLTKNKLTFDFYDSVQDKEAKSIKYPLYFFQKFAFTQEVDFFFAMTSLLLTGSPKYWFGDVELTFGLKIDSYNFYVGLVFIEVLVNAVFGAAFVHLINRILKSRIKLITVDLKKEALRALFETKWIVICFKGLFLYVLLFIFFNHI